MIVELLLNDQLVAIGSSEAILTEEKNKLDEKAGKSKPDEKKSKEERGEKRLKKLKWVRPGIRVRVISKKSRAKAHYNKKLTVTDVNDRYTFAALTEEGITVDSLREKDIETVMPRTGERAMVLGGKQAGEIGLLIERNAKKDFCLLQMEDMAVIKVSQNDCAAYILD